MLRYSSDSLISAACSSGVHRGFLGVISCVSTPTRCCASPIPTFRFQLPQSLGSGNVSIVCGPVYDIPRQACCLQTPMCYQPTQLPDDLEEVVGKALVLPHWLVSRELARVEAQVSCALHGKPSRLVSQLLLVFSDVLWWT